MVVFLSLLLIATGVGIGCYVSKSKFDHNITDLSSGVSDAVVDSENLQDELDRIEELKNNLREVRENVDALDIPTPECVSYYDDAQSSLNKLSRFFEKHSSATVGTEQLILSLLPSSQLGESLHSLAQVVPPDVGHAVFGDALSALKDGDYKTVLRYVQKEILKKLNNLFDKDIDSIYNNGTSPEWNKFLNIVYNRKVYAQIDSVKFESDPNRAERKQCAYLLSDLENKPELFDCSKTDIDSLSKNRFIFLFVKKVTLDELVLFKNCNK